MIKNPTDFSRRVNWLRSQTRCTKSQLHNGYLLDVYPFLTSEAKDQWNKALYHLRKLEYEIYREGFYKEVRDRFDKLEGWRW